MEKSNYAILPKNAIHTKKFQAIINHLSEDLRHKAYTFLISCYCNADFDGVIDLTNFEEYAKQLFMTTAELRLLVNFFIVYGILIDFSKDIDIYCIFGWKFTRNPNENKSESLEERIKRIAQWSDIPAKDHPDYEKYMKEKKSPKDL
ncbi:MAG: hypothetical protein IJ361_11035 [Spirochaetaceae bacterium]|nr:hypothetical protein [Spirochaetaceae bacterium]